ncbi:hypothetical protein [Nocardiopsis synnemataformans]|uniref:hypothetical protein n=1 Tax=Nocardiopsis synnemataformans TaxID=61305 RepID=UPI003EB75DC4
MEADLQRVYQVDLVDLWRPDTRLTLRKVAVLLRYLPGDALIWEATGQRTLIPVENQLARLWELHAEQESPDRPGPPHDPAKHKKAGSAERPPLADRLAAHAERHKERLQRHKAKGAAT